MTRDELIQLLCNIPHDYPVAVSAHYTTGKHIKWIERGITDVQIEQWYTTDNDSYNVIVITTQEI